MVGIEGATGDQLRALGVRNRAGAENHSDAALEHLRQPFQLPLPRTGKWSVTLSHGARTNLYGPDGCEVRFVEDSWRKTRVA